MRVNNRDPPISMIMMVADDNAWLGVIGSHPLIHPPNDRISSPPPVPPFRLGAASGRERENRIFFIIFG